MWFIGLASILGAAAMIVVARPRDGVPARFVDVWELGWIYALASTCGLVVGVALLIADWPLR